METLCLSPGEPQLGRINKTRINFKEIDNLIKDMGRKYSIRVGIIGDKAYQIYEGSGLTNAELGAVHEFGFKKINVTEKMRNYLHSQGLHLKKDTTTIEIPERSFLRVPILGAEGQKKIKKNVKEKFTKEWLGSDRELNKLGAGHLVEDFAYAIALEAFLQVEDAIMDDKIKPPTKPISKQMRKYNPEAPTLIDKGNDGGLLGSISYEVKEIK